MSISMLDHLRFLLEEDDLKMDWYEFKEVLDFNGIDFVEKHETYHHPYSDHIIQIHDKFFMIRDNRSSIGEDYGIEDIIEVVPKTVTKIEYVEKS